MRDDGEGETLAAVAARLARVVEAGAPSAAVNADNEAPPSSDDEDDDAGPPVSRAKRSDAELRGGARGTGTGDLSVAFPAIPGWR